MFLDLLDFSHQAFAITVILLVIGVASHIMFGFGTKRAKESILAMIFFLMVACQLYYLLQASLYIPASRFQVYNSNFVREDCRMSSKGGKRPTNSVEVEYLDPCDVNRKEYISDIRNCIGGMGSACTKDEPCFPCDRFIEFNAPRCVACSTNFPGHCNFVPEVGPYCYKRVGSKEVVPCQQCCTESGPIFNGTNCR